MSYNALLIWYRAEYARRTAAIKAGTADIDWMVPGYRVRWSEVVAKAEELGLDTSDAALVDLRLWLADER